MLRLIALNDLCPKKSLNKNRIYVITKRFCRTLITKRLCHYNNYRGKLTELISVPFKVIKSALEGAKDVLHGFKISIHCRYH